MASDQFESTVTAKLFHPDRGEEICSAMLERDPGFLSWNRMSLIGTQEDESRFLRFQGDGPFTWELHENERWPFRGIGEIRQQVSGTGIIRSIGMASGLYIADNGIQKFADVRIIKYVEELSGFDDGQLSASYSFLQRPGSWHSHRAGQFNTPIKRGSWKKLPATNLKFRLVSKEHRRNDLRISREVELLHIPGIEIVPLGDISPEAFIREAEELWFSLRILLVFRNRQVAIPQSENLSMPDRHIQIRYAIEIEPRDQSDGIDGLGFLSSADDFFARAAAVLPQRRETRELLHAAAWSYANSFKSLVLESRITSCVEAVERLVTVFETEQGFDRELLGRKDWRPIAAKLKQVVDNFRLSEKLSSKIKRGLAIPMALSLQERIERMISHYEQRWSENDRRTVSKLSSLIKARNDIVHGRLINDDKLLVVEGLRARLIFEKLFLSFVDCDELHSSGYTHAAISDIERTA